MGCRMHGAICDRAYRWPRSGIRVRRVRGNQPHQEAAITPNEAFFVRYHLSNIPEVDAATWKLAVDGEGATGRAEVTLDDLKKMTAIEIVAVNQCSGNRRGLLQPNVTGVEWGDGAMGCASAPFSQVLGRFCEGFRTPA
jgi:DMSO/TMAO reductase YedYZ molybdopterin-dependent catalytic subunit